MGIQTCSYIVPLGYCGECMHNKNTLGHIVVHCRTRYGGKKNTHYFIVYLGQIVLFIVHCRSFIQSCQCFSVIIINVVLLWAANRAVAQGCLIWERRLCSGVQVAEETK